MIIRNLTPHTITVHLTSGRVVAFLPDGTVARVTMSREKDHEVETTEGTIECYRNTSGQLEGLPTAEIGTLLIVSSMVAAARPRCDVYSPGELIRNEAGQPIGCRGLTASL